VSAVALLLLNGLLEPVLLDGGAAGLGLALNLGHLALVGLELAGNVGLLGRGGSGGDAELLHVALGVRGLDGGRFVGFQLLEVEVLDDVGWIVLVFEVLGSPVGELFYVPLTTAETAKVRRRVVVFCWRATRARDWRCGFG
jgi:hypothetical protein